MGRAEDVRGLVASARSRPGVGGGNPNLESQAVAYSEGEGAVLVEGKPYKDGLDEKWLI